jgi:hypothetical protein
VSRLTSASSRSTLYCSSSFDFLRVISCSIYIEPKMYTTKKYKGIFIDMKFTF